MEQKVEPPVKACVSDAARALQTIRSKARDWNLDPRRIGATGGSAGACTSLWLALHDDLADPKSSDPIARESSRLTCAAVSGAQTSLDPKELREWMPNAIYGGHAFGFAARGGPGRGVRAADSLIASSFCPGSRSTRRSSLSRATIRRSFWTSRIRKRLQSWDRRSPTRRTRRSMASSWPRS